MAEIIPKGRHSLLYSVHMRSFLLCCFRFFLYIYFSVVPSIMFYYNKNDVVIDPWRLILTIRFPFSLLYCICLFFCCLCGYRSWSIIPSLPELSSASDLYMLVDVTQSYEIQCNKNIKVKRNLTSESICKWLSSLGHVIGLLLEPTHIIDSYIIFKAIGRSQKFDLLSTTRCFTDIFRTRHWPWLGQKQ